MADRDFLLEGGVFTPDVLDAYMSYKHETEIGPVSLSRTPYEFLLYYGVQRERASLGEAPGPREDRSNLSLGFP